MDRCGWFLSMTGKLFSRRANSRSDSTVTPETLCLYLCWKQHAHAQIVAPGLIGWIATPP
jgi:hypothetical protein